MSDLNQPFKLSPAIYTIVIEFQREGRICTIVSIKASYEKKSRFWKLCLPAESVALCYAIERDQIYLPMTFLFRSEQNLQGFPAVKRLAWFYVRVSLNMNSLQHITPSLSIAEMVDDLSFAHGCSSIGLMCILQTERFAPILIGLWLGWPHIKKRFTAKKVS